MQRVAILGNQPHLWTVGEYMALPIEARTELLGGVIVDVSPKNEPHSFAVSALTEALVVALAGTRHIARIQDPIAISGWKGSNAPEIDVAVIVRKRYERTPTASDAVAFVEVSDTTYRGKYGDRTYKIPLYVNAGVPSWIVNLPLRQVEYYGTAADLKLKHGHVFDGRATVEIFGVAIPVASLFA